MKKCIVFFCMMFTTVFFAQDRQESFTEALAVQNDELVQTYNFQGYFQSVFMLHENANVLGKTAFAKIAQSGNISHLNTFLK